MSLQAINQQRLNEKEGKNQELRKRLFNIKNQKFKFIKKTKKKIRKRMMKKRSKQRYFIEVDSLEDCCVMII